MTDPFPQDAILGQPPSADSPPALRHAGVGIASFVIALIVGLVELVAIGLAGYFSIRAGGRMNQQSPEAIFSGLLLCGGLFLAVVGAALGIAGLLMKRRRRLFAVLGLVFNGAVLLFVAVLFLIGLAVKR